MPEAKKKPSSIVQAGVITAHVTSGPLPPAAEVRQYEELLPGSFDRILKMAEKNQQTDFELKKLRLVNSDKAMNKQFTSSIWAMVFAFSLCTISLITGVFVVYIGYPIVGTVFSAPCFIAILRYFLSPSKKE